MNLLIIVFKQTLRIIRIYKKETQYKQLSRYVLRQLRNKNAIYGEEYFTEPSVQNTSVLRDYVHHKLTKEHLTLPKARYGDGKVLLLQLLKWLENKQYRVQCGGLAQILYAIYRGFGYSAILSDWVDKYPSYYTDSHMLVEVYIPELNKYIIQDPSFNIMVTFHNKPVGTLQLMSILRNQQVLDNREIIFVNNQNGEEGVFTPVKDLNYENYIKKYFGRVFSWISGSNIMYPAVKAHRARIT